MELKVFENTNQLISYELRASLFSYTFIITDMNQFLILTGKNLTNILVCSQTRVSKANLQLRVLLCWASFFTITVL